MSQRYIFVIALIFSTLIQYQINKGFCQEQTDAYGFVDNGDGTVTDKKTKLMWQKGDNGEEVIFDKAKEYCGTLELGGYIDWRLPKVEEHDIAIIAELMMPKHAKPVSTWEIKNGEVINEEQDVSIDLYWSDDPTIQLLFNCPVTKGDVINTHGVGKESKAYVRAVRDITK